MVKVAEKDKRTVVLTDSTFPIDPYSVSYWLIQWICPADPQSSHSGPHSDTRCWAHSEGLTVKYIKIHIEIMKLGTGFCFFFKGFMKKFVKGHFDYRVDLWLQ